MSKLARYQAVLLEVLAEELSPAAARERLLGHPDLGSYREYLAALEPRMIAVAQELVRKWSVPSSR